MIMIIVRARVHYAMEGQAAGRLESMDYEPALSKR